MTDVFTGWGGTHIPYSHEAEEATIGAVLVNPDAYYSIAAFLHAEDFFILRHRYIWESFERLNQRGEPIEYLTVIQELKDTGRLIEIGGAAFITQLVNNTPDSTKAEVYARLVERAAVRRRLMAASDQIKGLALDEEMQVDDVLIDAQRRLMDVVADRRDERETSWYDGLRDYTDLMEKRIDGEYKFIGLPTGFTNLDKLLLGLRQGDFVVIAGRPGMGKSAWLLSTILNIYRDKPDAVVGWFSLEMSQQQLIERAISQTGGINSQALRAASMGATGWGQFIKATGTLSNYNLLIDDRRALTPEDIRAKCYQWAGRNKRLDLIAVDYLQLMRGRGFSPNNRVQEVTYIAEKLKDLAGEFGCPVIAAAQLSRAVEQRADKRPILSDLRESGGIEQAADAVMFLYRDEVYNENSPFINQGELIVGKNRNGPTGTVTLYFEKTLTKYMNAAERSVDLRVI